VRLARSLHLEAALLAGFLHHYYRFARASPSSGSRWSFVGSLALELGVEIVRPLGVRVVVAPGVCDRSRAHLHDGRTIWERSLFRLEAGASVVVAIER
jgi:hypothetical protein